MCQAPVLDTTDEESTSDEEPTPVPKKKTLRSGKLITANSSVLCKVVWPHGLVYTAASQPAVYDDISPGGVYLVVMEPPKPAVHPLMAQCLLELMEDAELYSWEPIRAFHAMLLQQLEHDHVTRADEDAKIKFRNTLVWHHATPSSKPVSAPFQQPQKKSAKECQVYNMLANSRI